MTMMPKRRAPIMDNKNNKRKCYISGPITGHDNYLDIFKQAESAVKEMGMIPVNPAEAFSSLKGLEWKDYMMLSIDLLFSCDAIFMLPNWEASAGASIEHSFAVGAGYIIVDGWKNDKEVNEF